jgi:hypothetical protein
MVHQQRSWEYEYLSKSIELEQILDCEVVLLKTNKGRAHIKTILPRGLNPEPTAPPGRDEYVAETRPEPRTHYRSSVSSWRITHWLLV